MWKNWSGSLSNPNATVSKPASRLELANVLRSAKRAGTQARAVGTGHSFSSLVDTDDTIISLNYVQGIIDVDDARRVVRVHAGTRLFALNAALEKHGYAMAKHRAEALREIRGLISKKAFPLMFSLEYRWVRGDDIWLSPTYGRDSVHSSAHQYQGMPYKQYFDGVQAICLNYGGRRHWGKMHTLKGHDLAKLYPRRDDFLPLRARMDSHGCFLSPYLRALFGLDRVSNPATPIFKERLA